jgi:methylphosphotriester-DNA--protein-cysteine methyltransferase
VSQERRSASAAGGGVEAEGDRKGSVLGRAAVARPSPYHFVRQFETATGLRPHLYVIMRRVDRA